MSAADEAKAGGTLRERVDEALQAWQHARDVTDEWEYANSQRCNVFAELALDWSARCVRVTALSAERDALRAEVERLRAYAALGDAVVTGVSSARVRSGGGIYFTASVDEQRWNAAFAARAAATAQYEKDQAARAALEPKR